MIVFDPFPSPMVDSAGTRMLGAARAAVRDVLRAEKLREHVGPIDRRVSVADVVDECQRSTRSA